MLSMLSTLPVLEPASPTSPFSSRGCSSTPCFHLSTAASCIPLASKGNQGEDAFYCSPRSLGVADGVGGWVSLGIDAGLYSRRLMTNAKSVVDCSHPVTPHPREILQRAYDAMPSSIVGTTTATICTLDGNLLKISNLGDSGVLLLRFSPVSWSWVPMFRTQEQTHYFNCPLQLGTDASDFPQDADTYEMSMCEHDIIVVATDGVFDNLFDDDIAACVTPHMDVVANRFDVAKAADAIAQAAIKASQNLTIQTPFSVGAKEHGISHSGGKQDDVTCVVGHVVAPPAPREPSPLALTIGASEPDEPLATPSKRTRP